jgi:hypothetical protein
MILAYKNTSVVRSRWRAYTNLSARERKGRAEARRRAGVSAFCCAPLAQLVVWMVSYVYTISAQKEKNYVMLMSPLAGCVDVSICSWRSTLVRTYIEPRASR